VIIAFSIILPSIKQSEARGINRLVEQLSFRKRFLLLDYVDSFPSLTKIIKHYNTLSDGEQCIIAATFYIYAWVNLRTTLTDYYVAGAHPLTGVLFHTESL
jgi:hypothetical protein